MQASAAKKTSRPATSRSIRSAVLSTLFTFAVPGLHAQFTTPQAPTGDLHNLGMLKPPANARVALVVFEDLGCPHCAAAHPVELAVAQRYHVPLVRYDAPIPSHVWTFQGAVNARYIQQKYGPQAAEDYRGDLFKAQMSIASPDDLQHFTQVWLERHGKGMPMLIDPDGSLARQVKADVELGRRINVEWTPTLIVVTSTRQQVVMGADGRSGEPDDIAPVVQAALAQQASGKTHNR